MDGWRKIFEACAFSLESTENVPNGLRSTIIFRPENKKIFFFRGTNVCSVRKKGLFRTEKVGNISFPWNKIFFRRPRMKNSKAEPAELPLRSGNADANGRPYHLPPCWYRCFPSKSSSPWNGSTRTVESFHGKSRQSWNDGQLTFHYYYSSSKQAR